MNNSINEFAYDVGCDYGFDRNTGRLSLIKRIIYNKTDNIVVGSYDKNGNFTVARDGIVHSISQGVLNVTDTKTDLSKTGISIPGGKQEEGIDMMKFISFNHFPTIVPIFSPLRALRRFPFSFMLKT